MIFGEGAYGNKLDRERKNEKEREVEGMKESKRSEREREGERENVRVSVSTVTPSNEADIQLVNIDKCKIIRFAFGNKIISHINRCHGNRIVGDGPRKPISDVSDQVS